VIVKGHGSLFAEKISPQPWVSRHCPGAAFVDEKSACRVYITYAYSTGVSRKHFGNNRNFVTKITGSRFSLRRSGIAPMRIACFSDFTAAAEAGRKSANLFYGDTAALISE
jgi:hypothetical protein